LMPAPRPPTAQPRYSAYVQIVRTLLEFRRFCRYDLCRRPALPLTQNQSGLFQAGIRGKASRTPGCWRHSRECWHTVF
jgi:hypothetical protein